MTIHLNIATKEKLERLAAETNRSKAYLAAEAITDCVERELAIVEGIKRGLADVAAGRVVPHAQAMAEVRQFLADARKSRKKTSIK